MLQLSAIGDIVSRETGEVPDERDNSDQRDRPERQTRICCTSW